MSYVEIKIPLNYIEANIVIDHLHQQNINCFLSDSYSSTIYPFPSAINARIMVEKKDLERATKIVKKFLSTAGNTK